VTTTPGPAGFADDAERYRLDSRIATGGMGEVWRATDTVLGREVAVKLLKTEYADDATFRSRFETEARHAAALHHPGIAAVFDVGEGSSTDGSGHPRPFLVMELVNGQPLSALVSGGRELDPAAVRDLLAQVGEALGAAHRAGIIHRDVKPANLIVTPQGKVKVTDFGIARAADGVGITRTGAVMGTPQYLSPEQAEGRPATAASDVYALGVVAFECLAGRRPFDAESPVATALAHLRNPVPDLPPNIPADLAAVVKRALSKNPAERYVDGAAFAAALRDPAAAVRSAPRAAGVPPVVIPDVGDEPRTQVLSAFAVDPTPPTGLNDIPKKRSALPVVLVVLLIVALAIVLTMLLTQADDQTDPSDPTTSAPVSSDTSSEPSSDPTTEDTTLNLNSSDYVNRDIDDVEAELRALGLRVQRVEVTNTNPEVEGLVSSVSPNGDVDKGELITLTYYGDAPEETVTSEPTTEPTTDPTATDTGLPSELPTDGGTTP